MATRIRYWAEMILVLLLLALAYLFIGLPITIYAAGCEWWDEHIARK